MYKASWPRQKSSNLREQYTNSSSQFINYGYIDVQYVVATGGRHCDILLWHLASESESHEFQYII